jgi:hypothetical protein
MSTFGIRYERPIGARLNGFAGVGYFKIEPQGNGIGTSNHASTTWNVGLTYRATPRLLLNGTYNYGATPSLLAGASYALTTAAEVRGDYLISSRMHASAGYRRSERNYNATPEISVGIPALAPKNQTRDTYFASLDFKLTNRISLALDARHDDTTSSLTAFNYNADIVGVSASLTF